MFDNGIVAALLSDIVESFRRRALNLTGRRKNKNIQWETTGQ